MEPALRFGRSPWWGVPLRSRHSARTWHSRQGSRQVRVSTEGLRLVGPRRPSASWGGSASLAMLAEAQPASLSFIPVGAANRSPVDPAPLWSSSMKAEPPPKVRSETCTSAARPLCGFWRFSGKPSGLRNSGAGDPGSGPGPGVRPASGCRRRAPRRNGRRPDWGRRQAGCGPETRCRRLDGLRG